MAQPLFKLILILFSINMLLYIGGIRVIGGDDVNLVGDFLNITKLESGIPDPNGEFISSLPTTFGQSGSGILDFIDSLGSLGKFIAFIVNIVFTPLGLFVSSGMPIEITLLIGAPLMVGLFLAAAYFLRGSG